LARQGLEITQEGSVYRVKSTTAEPDAPVAEVLLPVGFPLEGKALVQLSRFAAVRHPSGGSVCHACATPDIHPGTLVPVGAVIASADVVIPQAIGTDINCGMRMHVADLGVDEFLSKKEAFVERLRGDLLLGTRDLPMATDAVRAMFDRGVGAWLDVVRQHRLGALARCDLEELERECGRIYAGGVARGSARWAPRDLLPESRDVIRDPSLGTVGGGNHFVEIQVVDQVDDRRTAWAWGVRPGQLAFMIHTGSRSVGGAVGTRWSELAKERWPDGVAWPDIFSLQGQDAAEYIEAMNTAANYATVNRVLLAVLVRNRIREVFGDRAAPLVYDVPHNIVLEENGLFVHPSFLMAGCGNERFLSSCSHGAGRSNTRFEMTRKGRPKRDLGLEGVECITLREERLLEEAPAAYKEIQPVIDVQVEHGLVRPVARLRPLLTFKA
jgi:tRNA-splicing ligase RtcB